MIIIKNINEPEIIAAEKHFLVAYKPPRIHSAPQGLSSGETFFDWCSKEYPEIKNITGRKEGEGGLLHRLDFETHGLLLIARTSIGLESLLEQQEKNLIIKEYSCLVSHSKSILKGFPEKNEESINLLNYENKEKRIIKSAFRPFGPGRKAVRPLLPILNGDKLYATEISGLKKHGKGFFSLKAVISKGFRHQIRCHLAWNNLPILNDDLYGGPSFGKGFLALRAFSLTFSEPVSNRKKQFLIPLLELCDI